MGAAEGCTAPDLGDAAGAADAFGWVPGGAGGGLIAAAGWPCASEFWPATEVGFGVPLGCAEADGAGEAEPGPGGAPDASGDATAIGPAIVGFLFASSATVNCIARSIGIRTEPLVLSIQL